MEDLVQRGGRWERATDSARDDDGRTGRHLGAAQPVEVDDRLRVDLVLGRQAVDRVAGLGRDDDAVHWRDNDLVAGRDRVS